MGFRRRIIFFLSLAAFLAAVSSQLALDISDVESFIHQDSFNSDRLVEDSLKYLDFISALSDSSLETLLNATSRGSLVEPISDTQDPDINRNTSEIIRSRGFQSQEFDVVTRDGYILTIQRIINPLVPAESRPNLKPILLQHGLLASSADWVINSVNARPAHISRSKNQSFRPRPKLKPFPRSIRSGKRKLGPESSSIRDEIFSSDDTLEQPNSLGYYLANQGYDVYLGNSRGNTYGKRHVNISSSDLRFWDFTFDEHIEFDLRDTIDFILKLTNKTKLGYVGHSQGTAIMFGLLSEHPEYSEIVEPFIALAPVAFVKSVETPARYFARYAPYFQGINLWFATSSAAERYLASIICSNKIIRRDVCANILFLAAGFDLDELDDSRIAAYLAHSPAGTSVKNLVHYGQEINNGRFSHYDHGPLINLVKYGTKKPPDYPLHKIDSKSIVLFTADNDWLADPEDVSNLRRSLRVEPYKVYNITQFKPKWNHLDFLFAKHAGEIVNTRVVEALRKFD